MTVNHHLNPETIISFAAGTLSPAFALVSAAHVAMCQRCRSSAKMAEAIGGEMLEALPSAEFEQPDSNIILDSLGEDKRSAGKAPLAADANDFNVLPIVQPLVAGSFDHIRWKMAGYGIGMCSLLDSDEDGKLFLLKIASNQIMPEHGHGGNEVTLILSGAYEDKFGRFARGDVADLVSEVDHQPIVGNDAECICLVATEKPTVFKSMLPRLFQPLIGI